MVVLTDYIINEELRTATSVMDLISGEKINIFPKSL